MIRRALGSWLFLWLAFPLMIALLIVLMTVSNRTATSLGENPVGYFVEIGGAALFFGLFIGYLIVYTRSMPRSKKFDQQRPYSDYLTAMIAESLEETAPEAQDERRAYLDGFIAGARFAGDSADCDDQVETELRRRNCRPRQ